MIPPYLADTRVAKLTFFPEGGNLIEGITVCYSMIVPVFNYHSSVITM